jgi:putative ABC transport system substrate-binding protein
VRRRDFIAGLGVAAAWPLAARAQQAERMRRIGVLMGWTDVDPEARSWLAAFVEGLREFGWSDGTNVRIEPRWMNADAARARAFARELVELQPDAIVTGSTPATAAVHRETSTIPIVFAVVNDPVGEGFVEALSRPAGNITGFLTEEAGIGGKWLQMLKDIAPHIRRAAMMFNPDTAPGGGRYHLGAFEAAARSLGVEPVAVRVRSEIEIDAAITTLGREQGCMIMSDAFMTANRATVISSAARNNVPVIADISIFARDGGLISYGPSFADLFRRAGSYVDRILRGAKPADLPVQVPIRYNLVINLKTAKALGIAVPNTLLVSADEVIE